ncbi:hypothetical protein E3N88_13479 [Mikania micrantha]|uniref:Pentacotripeptide-repeat region of PRORP domain-containing protein n=1 Tax=Mikania micrantha TaxID=192012 RepID=A0A5N6P8M2_9ASTR|nr:hypothetical protein E3N88_13479 [Mikania micrantha]
MPPQAAPPATVSNKFSFFYGHRKPSQNRRTVRGGLFTNRQTLNPNQNHQYPTTSFDLQKWSPEESVTTPPRRLPSPSQHFFAVAQSLSPIARYIIDSFRKHKHWGPQVVADLNKLRRVTPKLVAEVLKVQSDPIMSSKFFHWAGKQKGYRHDFASYNAFAYCLNRNNQFRAADQVPELMNMQGKPPTEKQFEILIRMHSDSNRGLRVYYVYEKMLKFGVKPRVFLYNRIMDALVKTGHVDLAMSVYSNFKNDGLMEEGVTFMILIKGLCKVGRVKEALGLLNQMRNLCKPDVFAYTAMIRILVSEGDLDGCLRVWKEMESDKVQPDVMAYATLVMGLCKGNRVDKGYEFFKEMKDKRYLIDRAIYGSLIEGFVNDGKVGVACDLLKDLVNSGYRADLMIYNHLIKGLCNVNHVSKAHTLLKVIVEEDLKPDFETVNPMLEMSLIPSVDAYVSLVKGLCKIGEIDSASVLVRECLANVTSGPREFMYFLRIVHTCRLDDANKVMVVINEMVHDGCQPDDVILCAVISGMCQYGTIEEARKVFSGMRECKMLTESDLVIYDDLLIDHMKKKTADLVLSGLKFFRLESKLKAKGSNLLPNLASGRMKKKKTAELVLCGWKFFRFDQSRKGRTLSCQMPS